MTYSTLAEENLKTKLTDNPCRGLAVGRMDDGASFQLSWIMGRSENSQNRIYIVEGSTVRTAPFDASKVKDPRLIIYNAMRTFEAPDRYPIHVVSNGDQTDTVYNALMSGQHATSTEAFNNSLAMRHCEPDAPVLTPRITAITDLNDTLGSRINILLASPEHKRAWIEKAAATPKGDMSNDNYCAAVSKSIGLDHTKFPTANRTFPAYCDKGFGYCITTYKPGSKDLPSFDESPFIVPAHGSKEQVMMSFWKALDPRWRVSLAAKVFRKNDIEIAVLNKHQGA